MAISLLSQITPFFTGVSGYPILLKDIVSTAIAYQEICGSGGVLKNLPWRTQRLNLYEKGDIMRSKMNILLKQGKSGERRMPADTSENGYLVGYKLNAPQSRKIGVSPVAESPVQSDLNRGTYNVNETFLSIQGEGGPGLGRLAYFVRFQICNLRCNFCDTKFTWTPTSDPIDPGKSKGEQKWKSMTHQELLTLLRSQPSRRIIFTGGEPLMTNFSKIIADLDDSYKFEVETNGTIIPHEYHGGAWVSGTEARVQWNVSPKFKSNSRQMLDEKVMRWWASQQGALNVYFKLVVRHKDDREFDQQLDEVLEMVREYGLDGNKVLIMLEGVTVDSQLQNLAYYVGRIISAGLNWSPRLHILVWGDKRGV